MQLIDNRCPNCMGNVVRIPGSNMGECESCGSRFTLGGAPGAGDAAADAADEGEEVDVTEEFNELIEEFCNRYGDDDREFVCGSSLHSAGRGRKKLQRAREYFDIDDDVADDEVYVILDTTVMGSGKIGFAICDDGWYCKDEDGDVRYLNWEDYACEDIERDGGTIDIGGSQFFSNSDDAKPLYKLLQNLQDLFN